MDDDKELKLKTIEAKQKRNPFDAVYLDSSDKIFSEFDNVYKE